MPAAHIGTEAAHRKREVLEKEEEQMTPYTREDQHQDWEFKIVRASTNPFRNPENLQTLIEEEALAGWEMVKKFDDNRVRFKRSTQNRRRDSLLPPGVDPYRTQYGLAEGQIAMIIIGVVLALTLMGVLIAIVFAG